jgi:hypothetical protein
MRLDDFIDGELKEFFSESKRLRSVCLCKTPRVTYFNVKTRWGKCDICHQEASEEMVRMSS